MNEAEFQRLLDKYLQGKASPGERALLEKWLASMKDKDNEWSTTDQSRMLQNINERIDGQPGRTVIPLQPWKWAAVAAMVLVVAYASFHVFRSDRGWLTVRSHGPTTKVSLADGSVVWLKGDSQVSYPREFADGTRQVELTGEALFSVAKDPDHPFVIECAGTSTTVLGTSFNIASSGEQVEVVVLTGTVRVRGGGSEVILKPLDKGTFKRQPGQLSKSRTQQSQCVALLSDTDYTTVEASREKTAGDLIDELAHRHNIQVTILHRDWLDCRITMDVGGQSLEESLGMLQKIFDIKYTIREKSITIEGGRCR